MEAAPPDRDPDTVPRWQRRRFREHWTTLSGRPTGGRPPVNAELKALVTRMAAANPLWGAPRIHGELLKLGIDVAERTVSRLIPKRPSRPSQTWRAFLTNHVRDLVAVDFFTVPTARLRVLFVLVVLAHHRRRALHFNVAERPTAAWTERRLTPRHPAPAWGVGPPLRGMPRCPPADRGCPSFPGRSAASAGTRANS